MVVWGTSTFGEGLWKGQPVWVGSAPPWAGLQNFRVVSLGPAVAGRAPLLLLLGGRWGSSYRNAVWRSRDGGISWEEVSPQEDGRPSASGRVVRTKWAGREGFAAAGGWTAQRGGLQSLVYVVGGLGPVSPPYADVWVSEDLGRTFVRTCADAPFGRRVSSGLAVCPGRPQRAVLVGGGWNDDVDRWDCWLTMDAGEHWAEIQTPANSLQRRMPVVALPRVGVLLVLGGHSRRAPYPDAHVARLRWPERQATWQKLQLHLGDHEEEMDEMPEHPDVPWFLGHCTVFDARSGEFVGPAPGGRAAVGRLPRAALLGRLPLPAEQLPLRVALQPATLPRLFGSEAPPALQLHLVLAADSRRLFLLAADGVRATGCAGAGGELQRQLRLLGQLGRTLVERHGLLEDAWGAVLVALLGPGASAAGHLALEGGGAASGAVRQFAARSTSGGALARLAPSRPSS